ncbi:MAG: ATP-binding protein [Verrucomicrobiales bacterium]
MSGFFKSIRWRLQLWHGVLLVLVLAGYGWTSYRAAMRHRMASIDRELQRHSAVLIKTLPPWFPRNSPSNEPSSEESMELRIRPSAPLLRLFEESDSYFLLVAFLSEKSYRSPGCPEDLPIPEPFKKAAHFRFETRGEFREFAQPGGRGYRVLVGRNIGDDLAEMRRFAWILCGAGGGVLLVGLTGGWWLATRAIRPVRTIGETAKRIADGKLEERIDLADTDSELGELAGVLNETFDGLHDSLARQVRFTADASHELRTPVSVVLAQTQTALKRERSGDESRDTIEACQRASERMRHLVESLLTLAQLDSGEEEVVRETVEVERTARETVELMQPLAVEKGVKLVTALESSVRCEGDPERLAQVVTNLLSNAILHTAPGGEVRVSVTREEAAAVLVVEDTGEGIAEADLEQIFDRFYRADRSRGSANGGSGLGLAITKAIVESHGGSIEVASVPGEGTTFTVRLIATPDPVQPR